MIFYSNFYRQHGIRRLQQLVSPKINALDSFAFPQNSVWHYLSPSPETVCVGVDDYLLRGTTGPILVEHATQLATALGHPRKLFTTIQSLLKTFYRKNRRMRPVTDLGKQARSPQTLVIENYATLPHFWKYPSSPNRDYYQWSNDQATLWKNVERVAKTLPNRQQFIALTLPEQLPMLTTLQRAERGWTRPLQKFISTPELFMIMELWLWLGGHRSNSLLHELSGSSLDKINLVWRASGRWMMINLGYLENWRKGVPEDPEEGEEPIEHADGVQAGTIKPDQLQKRFLRLLMFLAEVRTDLGTNSPNAEIVTPPPVTPTPGSAPTLKVVVNDSQEDQDDETHVVEAPRMVSTGVHHATGVPPALKVLPLVEPLHVEMTGSLSVNAAINQAVEKDLTALEEVMQGEIGSEPEAETPATREPDDDEPVTDTSMRNAPLPRSRIEPYTGQVPSLEDAIVKRAGQLAKLGAFTGAEYRRMERMSSTYKSIPNPRGGEGTLADMLEIKPEELVVKNPPKAPDMPTVFDKSMLHSSVHEFDKQYIDNILPKDLTSTVLNVQRAGVAVTGYQINEVENAGNHYEEHVVKLTPLQGARSTIRFRVPKVKSNGTFLAGGVQYRMRKQRGDVPIRKVNKDQVALTSYYGKVYVKRGEKMVNNYPAWLQNRLVQASEDPEGLITKAMISNSMISDVVLPRDYTIVAQKFKTFTAKGHKFIWDYTKRMELLNGTRARIQSFEGEDTVPEAQRDVLIGCGATAATKWDFVLMRPDGTMYVRKNGKESIEELGTVATFMGLDTKKAPKEVVEITIGGKQIPVGIVLSYLLGWTGMLKLIDAKYRNQPSNQRVSLEEGEFAVRFEDETFIFSRKQPVVAMIMAGFDSYRDTIRHYSVHTLDLKDTYYNILDDEGLGVRFLREMELMNDMFVDPITLELLKTLHEPEDFIGLVLKAVDLLKVDWSPEETDMQYMRIKGYERMAGAVYGELVRSIRLHRSKPGQSTATIEMPPFAVWQSITQDPAVSLVEESNPIHNLKEKEEITYAGTGGRSARSMVERTRKFHPNDMGVISEATKDSSDVAITSFLTADPGLMTLRGLTKKYVEGDVGPTALMSTSALLAPQADRDDPKRVNFISIQQSSGISAVGYRPTPLRTGYESIVAHRTDELFAHAAGADGVVSQVTPNALVVTYKDGTAETVELGRRFGVAAGTTFPHELETTFKEGDKVKQGDILAFNNRYFEPDYHQPRQVLWKAGILTRVALMESMGTLEDSCEISEATAKLMTTHVTKVRSIALTFDQIVHDFIKVGEEVDIESILCTIEDPVGPSGPLFDQHSLDTLSLLSKQTPRAKSRGKVERIEVFYYGDPNDMSPSLKELATASDRERRATAKELGKTFTSGRVDDTMRFEGDPLTPNTLVVRVYITGEMSAGIGDKGVLANQMKTIIGNVWSGDVTTESGDVVDVIFSYTSISNRIVLSPLLIGLANTVLMALGKQAGALYKAKMKGK